MRLSHYQHPRSEDSVFSPLTVLSLREEKSVSLAFTIRPHPKHVNTHRTSPARMSDKTLMITEKAHSQRSFPVTAVRAVLVTFPPKPVSLETPLPPGFFLPSCSPGEGLAKELSFGEWDLAAVADPEEWLKQ